jgi:hypothetical protein
MSPRSLRPDRTRHHHQRAEHHADFGARDGELVVDRALLPEIERPADRREHEAEVGAVGQRRMHVEDLLDHTLTRIDRRSEHRPPPRDHEQSEQHAERSPRARDAIE